MLRVINNLTRGAKQTIVLCFDIGLVPVALIIAFALQMNGLPPFDSGTLDWLALPLLMLIAGLLSFSMGIHRIQLKSYESRAIGMTAIHAVIMGVATATLDDLANYGTALATFINFAIVYFLFAVGLRMILLQVLLMMYRRGKTQFRVLIYGAGRTGRHVPDSRPVTAGRSRRRGQRSGGSGGRKMGSFRPVLAPWDGPEYHRITH